MPRGIPNKKKKISTPSPKKMKIDTTTLDVGALSKPSNSLETHGKTEVARDSRGKFLPGHPGIRNVRNPFKKILDSIILENPENLKLFEQTVVQLLTKSAIGELQAISILFRYLMPGIAEHGLETIASRLRTSTAAELSESMDKVIEHMADGELSTEAANVYVKCLDVKRNFILTEVMETKINVLEQRVNAKK